MNYTGLFITEAIFALIVTLWFARQLNWFSFYKTINDPKGILLPTTVLLIGLIVIPNVD